MASRSCADATIASPNILILGCGVVGLNTALRLQSDYPNAKVSIMAEKFNSELVSTIYTLELKPGLE